MSTPQVPVPGVIPNNIMIGWQKWIATADRDTHGNVKGAYTAAQARPAQGFYQVGTQQPVSLEYATRQVTELIVMVPDPQTYSKRDRIIVGGSAQDDGTYVGGKAFEMDGHPEDWLNGSPFPEANGLFGGQLLLKRTG